MNDAQKVMGVITLALTAFMAAHQVVPLIEIGPNPNPEQVIQNSQAFATHAQAIAASDLPEFIKQNHVHLLPTEELTEGKGKPKPKIPTWVIISCALAMCLGTMAGGKRIIKTMGTKIIKISPLQGFAAQTSGTATIIAASLSGIPVSTTHCITASVMGAGVSRGLAAVRWGMAVNILIAWVLTLPASAGVAWVSLIVLESIFGR